VRALAAVFSLVANILGGVGLFLLGMALMSDGLRAVGGDALRSMLQRFTGNRFSSVATGTLVTALVQSSSATTLMTIGFVSAGLLTFSQSIGVIIGANLGTTMTSWLVALIGLKVKISSFALPMVGVGAFLHLLGRGRWAKVGGALAGFGLIFVGIDVLQTGMQELSTQLSPADFAVAGIGGRLLLVGVGIVMTVIMQSSSAAVAATLTALSTGTIDVVQAAALVIGQNVGTTVTAALGSIGATIPARRTALAHILFNGLTGLIAFLMLPVFVGTVNDALLAVEMGDDATIVAAFHTAFNVLGVVALLPFVGPFSRLIERIVPGPEKPYTSHLDDSAQMVPAIALDAVHATISEMLADLVDAMLEALDEPGHRGDIAEMAADIEEGITRTRAFLSGVQSLPSDEALFARHLAVLHALDHLERCVAWTLESQHFGRARSGPELAPARELLVDELRTAGAWLDDPQAADLAAVADLSAQLDSARKRLRIDLLEKAASVSFDVFSEQRTLNWLNRIGYHVWRSLHHLSGQASSSQPPAEPLE
jgi:phosphate:Na+ symporter